MKRAATDVKEQGSHAQEWTAERLIRYLDTKTRDGSFKDRMQLIANDINAALAAEREKLELIRQEAREKHRQLLQAESAIAEACKVSAIAKAMFASFDLSALDKHDDEVKRQIAEVEAHNIAGTISPEALAKHDEEVRKPLVEALEQIGLVAHSKAGNTPEQKLADIAKRCDHEANALAKVKQ